MVVIFLNLSNLKIWPQSPLRKGPWILPDPIQESSSDSSESEQVVFMVPNIGIEPPGPIFPFFLKIDLIIKMNLPQPLLTLKRIYIHILMKWRIWGRNHPLKLHDFLFFHISIVAYLQLHILNAYSYFKLLKIDA